MLVLSGCWHITDEDLDDRLDVDGDGIALSVDCDDRDPKVGGPNIFYVDVDGDGYGGETQEKACEAPANHVNHNGDCDDTDGDINPDALEVCNGYDDNCDGGIDDDEVHTTVWYADTDEDTYGDPDVTAVQCDEPDGFVDNAEDCDDSDFEVKPGAEDICDDGIDQDCNGEIDDNDAAVAWYPDLDGDGFGDPDNVEYACDEPVEGYLLIAGDCDDSNPDANPDAAEQCDNDIDDNCDGTVDEDVPDSTWYYDGDGDGYGVSTDTVSECSAPEGYAGNADDCDDSSGDINPAAEEVCMDGVDNDCDDSLNDCVPNEDLSLANVNISGISSEELSGSSICFGDFDNDGNQDIATGAPPNGSNAGAVYVFFGPISGATDANAADATIHGDSTGDSAGNTLACMDFNNDGFDDLVVGAHGSDLGPSDGGAVYLFLHVSSLVGEIVASEADAIYTGEESSDAAGISVANAGDFNNDGFDDLLVGAYGSDRSGSNSGAVYLILGNTSPGEIESLSSATVIFTGRTAGDSAGSKVSGIGDFDNDGFDDFVIGAPSAQGTGVVYLLLGYSSPSGTMSLTAANASFVGEAAGDAAGFSISGAGDVNNDGYDDFLVGAFIADTTVTDSGKAYLILGGTPPSGETNLSMADAAYTGINQQDYAGCSVAGAGDVNNDGYDDILVGAYWSDTIATDGGSAYLILGDASPNGTTSLADADYEFSGLTTGDQCGKKVASVDMNGDGYSDISVGCPYANTGSSNTGTTYLIYGSGQ